MKKRYVFIPAILLFGLLLVSTVFTLHKGQTASRSLNDLSNQFLHENDYFRNLIDSVDFDLKKHKITINANVTVDFQKMDTSEQFGSLSYYAKYLRHYLRNDIGITRYQTLDIEIICKTEKNTYILFNKIPDKKVKVLSESDLFINNERVLSSKEYKIKIEQYIHKNPDIVDADVVVIRYAMDLFNKITVGGKYYNHKKDSKVILDLTTNKFDITEEEYVSIYKKYFYLFE